MGKGVRVGLLTPWLSRRGGGVFEAVAMLAQGLKRTGRVEPVVIGLGHSDDAADAGRLAGVPVMAARSYGPARLGFAPSLRGVLERAELDVLHLHGVWMWTSAAAAGWSGGGRRPYAISPHGMLDPWILRRGRLQKAAARLMYEDRSLASAWLIHALTPAEAGHIRAVAPGGATVVIPNGVEMPEDLARTRPDPPYFLYLGRLHPKKNLEGLLAAWASLGEGSWRLKIAGWGEPAYVQALQARMAGVDGVDFLGPVFGVDKARLLAQAAYLVQPSFSEGLPMVVLEAWAAGTPALITRFCNLEIGVQAGAAVEIGVEPQAVAAALIAATLENPEAWVGRSRAAQALARREFSIAAVAERWANVYRAMADAGSRAAFTP